MQPSDTVVCYILGDRSLDASRIGALRSVIEQHIGSPYEYAAVMHLGSELYPLLIGDIELFGPVDSQARRLDRFMATVPAMLGEFGSWWPETFDRIRAISKIARNAAIRLCLFRHSAHPPPFDWDPDTVDAWLAGRPARSTCSVIVSEKHAGDTCHAFGDWLAQLPAGLIGAPERAIVVGTTSSPLPVPSIRLPGASSSALNATACEIMLPLRAGWPGRFLELARFDGVEASDIRVTLR
jgi:hypothetical protein